MRRLLVFGVTAGLIGIAVLVPFFFMEPRAVSVSSEEHELEVAAPTELNDELSVPARVANGDFDLLKSSPEGGLERASSATWVGRVVDQAGRGVVDATVLLVNQRANPGPGDITSGLETKSGEEGRFQFDVGGRQQSDYYIAAQKRSYTTAWEAIHGEEVVLVLRPGSNLVGRVLDDATGLPLSDTRVRCVDDRVRTALRPEVVTGVDGAFRLDGLRTGQQMHIRVEPSDAIGIDRYVRTDNVGDNAVDFRIDRGQVLRGVVMEAGTHLPVAGAEVLVNDAMSLRSDAEGHFELRCRQEYLRFEARHPEYAGSQQQVLVDEPRVGLLVTLLMIPQCSLTGVVRDGEGNPIAGARVMLNRGHMLASAAGMARAMPFEVPEGLRLGQSGGLSATTDDSGRYEIGGLLPFVTYARLNCISDDRRLSYETIAFAALGEKKVLDVSFSASFGTVSGSVLVDGEPSAGSVTWSKGRWLASSDIRDGQYRLVGVPAGLVELRLWTSPVALRRQEVVAITDGSDLRHDFVMTSNRRQVGGAVVGFDGVGMPGLRLSAKKGEDRLATRTGSDGSFSFDLPESEPGSWWIQVEDWGWGRDAYPGSTEVRIVGGPREGR